MGYYILIEDKTIVHEFLSLDELEELLLPKRQYTILYCYDAGWTSKVEDVTEQFTTSIP